jgi:hypothetical protein
MPEGNPNRTLLTNVATTVAVVSAVAVVGSVATVGFFVFQLFSWG